MMFNTCSDDGHATSAAVGDEDGELLEEFVFDTEDIELDLDSQDISWEDALAFHNAGGKKPRNVETNTKRKKGKVFKERLKFYDRAFLNINGGVGGNGNQSFTVDRHGNKLADG